MLLVNLARTHIQVKIGLVKIAFFSCFILKKYFHHQHIAEKTFFDFVLYSRHPDTSGIINPFMPLAPKTACQSW